MSQNQKIPEQMQALRLTAYKKDYELISIPVPKLGENDLLIKIGAAGFCHTDYQVYEGTYQSECPLTPSHEPVGTIVAMGDKVDKSEWQIGNRIGMLNFRHPCGKCSGCRWAVKKEGGYDARFCEAKDMAGVMKDGGMAEYAIADSRTSVHLPESVSFEQGAPLMCAGATVWGGIMNAKLRKGDAVAIVGIGGLGSLGVQFAKALGYRTVAIDNRKQGLDLANEFDLKPDLVVDYNDKKAVEKVMDFTDGIGLEAVVCCTEDPPVNDWSLQLIQPQGTLVTIGLPGGGFHFDAFGYIFKEINIKGSLLANVEQTRAMMKVVDEHKIRSHITTVKMQDAKDIPQQYMNKDLKGRLVVTVGA